uniref:Uncharacterized protein n=1 Tax=Globisporangium ultimum (strain ATCC 200006 / CBS 805.95 / DAOM BR144) TaxID=431595 RepID=K3WI90_GLOUD
MRTAWGWVRAARSTDTWIAQRWPHGGFRHRKITEEHVNYLCERLSGNCNLTLSQMVDSIDDHFRIKVADETVYRALNGVCYNNSDKIQSCCTASHLGERH